MRTIALLSGLLLLTPATLRCQERDNTQERLRALEERIRALEAELRVLKTGPVAPTTQPPPEPPPEEPAPPAGALGASSGPLPVYSGSGAAAKALNPDIGVIGDFLGTVGNNPVRSIPGLEMHETEASFQAIVDPYASADFFLAFTPEGVELEEGYITLSALPGGLVAKLGKMRSSFGKVNTLHNHNLPWVDRPLVAENLLGGEEGISDAGISVSRILPAPKNIFLEATAQVFRGNSADVFAASRNSDVSFVGHLRGYRDLSESTNLDLGYSYARGRNDLGNGLATELHGADATLRWKPLRRAIYHSFLARIETVWSDREEFSSAQRAFGLYGSGEYRLSRRWTAGARYDWSDRMRDSSQTDKGFSALFTYWPSEFSQIRGQYRISRYAEGLDAGELRFQFLFNIGRHGAHPF